MEGREDRYGFDPGSVFDPVADEYEAARPRYPEAFYLALEGLIGPLHGQRVIDVGAGTGISTRGLAARGALVVAIDPSLTMLRHARAGGLCASVAQGEALPFRSACADAVSYAQAWHWVTIDSASGEARRVLRDGGHLALWWNVSDTPAGWLDDLASRCGLGRYGVGDHQADPSTLIHRCGFQSVDHASVSWDWTVTVEQWVRVASTRSTIAAQGQRPDAQLEAIRLLVANAFPNGIVTERFTVHLTVAVP